MPANRDYPSPSPAILSEDAADVYFVRTRDLLKTLGLNPTVSMDVFPSRDGVLCGINEAMGLLRTVLPLGCEVWGLHEGEELHAKEPALRIKGPYLAFAVYETVLLGLLAQTSGWATAARHCVQAARGRPVISFGARHVHPQVGGIMDYAAIVGGCVGCSTTAGARLAGIKPTGTMPHALILVMGDTVAAALAFDQHMPPEVPRIVLVDTFKDEVEESLRVAEALDDRLLGVRLDTPAERGRVTADLVKETRAKLDLAGHRQVQIVVSGGVTPERITYFLDAAAPVDVFAVGSYITANPPIDFTADIKEVEGKPVAKRGRLPGPAPNPRMRRLL